MDHSETDGHDPADEDDLDAPELADAVDDDGYGVKVGERLRAIRRQKGLSLQEVEAASRQEFKASVVGAYERGERAISVPRLQRLAALLQRARRPAAPPRADDEHAGVGRPHRPGRCDEPPARSPSTSLGLRELDDPRRPTCSSATCR